MTQGVKGGSSSTAPRGRFHTEDGQLKDLDVPVSTGEFDAYLAHQQGAIDANRGLPAELAPLGQKANALIERELIPDRHYRELLRKQGEQAKQLRGP